MDKYFDLIDECRTPGKEEIKNSSVFKINEQESQKDFAGKFGTFGYSIDDNNTYCTHYDTEEEAKAAAVELAKELNGKDLAYVEVWQADEEGRFGATGEPIWRREYSAESKTSVEKKELNLEKQYQNLVDECRKAAKEKVSSESKVTEQEEEPGLEEPPAPPEEVKEPETEDMEMRKEYLGKSEDTHYYFITTEGAVGEAEDLLITDQEGVKKYSAKDHNMDVSEKGIADFIIKAIQDVKIEQIERSIFMKYILPKLEEETPEEEIIGEPEEKEPKEEKPKEKKPKEEPTKIPPEEEPLESIKSKTCEFTKIFEGKIDLITTSNLKKFLADGEDLIKRSKEINLSTAGLEAVISKIQIELEKRETDKKTIEGKSPQQGDKEATQIKKLSEMKVTDPEGNTFDVHLVDDGTMDTVIDIEGREFRFDPEFASYWRDEEGALSEEGLKELALDALANIEEEEYAELVAKGKGEEEEEAGEVELEEPSEEDLDQLVAKRDELKAKEEAGTLTPDMKEELVDLEKRIKELGGAVESKTNEIKKGDTDMAEINKDKKQSTLESIKADIANWVNSVAEKKDLIDLWSKISENDIKDEQVVDDKVDEVKPENKADEAKVEGEDAEAIAKKSAAHHAKQDKAHTAKPTQGKQLGDPKEDADKIAKQSDALHKKQDKSHAIKAGDLKQLKSSSESIEEKLFTKQFEDLAVNADFMYDGKRCVKHSETEYKCYGTQDKVYKITPKTEVEAIEKPRRENKEENVDEATEGTEIDVYTSAEDETPQKATMVSYARGESSTIKLASGKTAKATFDDRCGKWVIREDVEEPEEDEEIDILNDDIQNIIDEMLDSDEVLDEAKKKLVGKSGRPLKKGAAGRSRGRCVFPYEHSKVTDKKDHFPINSENQARNALARVNQYKKAPKWYEGSIESLVKTVANAVKKAYPDIKVSKAAEKPGKGPKESKIPVEEEQISISERKGLERLNELLGLNG
jgi:hypothetical protein